MITSMCVTSRPKIYSTQTDSRTVSTMMFPPRTLMAMMILEVHQLFEIICSYRQTKNRYLVFGKVANLFSSILRCRLVTGYSNHDHPKKFPWLLDEPKACPLSLNPLLFGMHWLYIMVLLLEELLHTVGIKTVMPLLGGGFKYFLFSPLFGEDFQFD